MKYKLNKKIFKSVFFFLTSERFQEVKLKDDEIRKENTALLFHLT